MSLNSSSKPPRVLSIDFESVTLSAEGSKKLITKDEFFKGHKSNKDFSLSLNLEDKTIAIDGKGSLGLVYFGLDGEKEVAVKIVEIVSHKKDDILAEVSFLLKMAESKNIVGSKEIIFVSSSKGKEPSYVCMVMEKLKGGDLRVKNREKDFSISEKLHALKGAALGLKELHDQGIVHRDIKEENILLCDITKEAKLTDLEGCQEVSKIRSIDYFVSPRYGSPEAKAKEIAFVNWAKQHQKGRDSKKLKSLKKAVEKGICPEKPSDIYNFGIMMHQLLAHPDHTSSKEYEKRIVSLGAFVPSIEDYDNLPKDLQEKALKLVASCLKEAPEDRIVIGELLKGIEKLHGESYG